MEAYGREDSQDKFLAHRNTRFSKWPDCKGFQRRDLAKLTCPFSATFLLTNALLNFIWEQSKDAMA
jgi:hypothetical protein